jgi:hypothetical protein
MESRTGGAMQPVELSPPQAGKRGKEDAGDVLGGAQGRCMKERRER